MTSAQLPYGTPADVAGVGTLVWNMVPVPRVGLTTGNQSHWLVCDHFGFAIPAGRVIKGIQVDFFRSVNVAGTGLDAAVRMVKGGVIGSTDRSSPAAMTIAGSNVTYGGPTDLWGTTWTPADINNPMFGWAYSAANPGPPGTLRVTNGPASLLITVYHDPPPTQLGKADHVKLGAASVDRVYAGDMQAWPDPHDPATAAYMAATGLDPSYAPALDGLVRGLKSAGLWAKMLAVYPFAGGTEALHRWNLKDPRDLDAAYRLTFTAASGSHSTALGYRPNAAGDVFAGGFADTHLTPSTQIADVNSTHLAFYSLQDVPPEDRTEMGCYNWSGPGSRFHVIACYNGSLFYYGMSEDGGSNCAVSGADGLFVATRTSAGLQSAYRNGAGVGSSPAPPTNGLPDRTVWIGGIDSYRGYSDLPCGFASIGSGLTATDNANLYTVVQAYETALGRAV